MSKSTKPNAFNTAYADLPGGLKWLTGDASWEDYGGSWFKELGETRVFLVVTYENGHEFDKGLPRHMIEVKLINVAEMNDSRLATILQRSGYEIVDDAIVDDHSGNVLAKRGTPEWNWVIVEASLSHSAYAPLDSFSGDKGLRGLIRAACRSVQEYAKNDALRTAALKRPVNQIGSTAEEYARGDLASALNRAGRTTRASKSCAR